jgi:hypothetical protein
MTDAFRCNRCDEYYDEPFEFVNLYIDADALTHTDFTIDDIPTEAFGLLEGDLGNRTPRGDFCPDCGLELLELLVAEFYDSDRE